MWQEVAICVAFPILMLPIVYLVQRYRYNIFESIGPGALPIYPSWPGILVGYGIPLAITVTSLIYACKCFSVSGVWLNPTRPCHPLVPCTPPPIPSYSRFRRLQPHSFAIFPPHGSGCH